MKSKLSIITEDMGYAIRALDRLPHNEASLVIIDYIRKNDLHDEYIDQLVQLGREYTAHSANFIRRFKQDVNALYIDKQFGHNVLQNVDINEKNWFWYARLLRDTEDEEFPKQNFFQPTYLLGRLKPIIANIDVEKIKDKSDDELYELYKICLDLMSKYGTQNCDCNKEVKKENE